ncbi:hypothetical protein L915_01006 [Phytophthora nicotianae]|uniref:PiggyBac transposable element-derived protein domain-containing protein n=1 Tax=Phytophthora nicotianae TaxID=4792 RepID=W2HLY2_PHYNI|nr:hypothetical protein L915_01006 [Phytophthora nicotianae]
MAFDEAMLPSRLTFNLMRVYLKDKLQKWGTMIFMFVLFIDGILYSLCYLAPFELYCAKKKRSGIESSTDYKLDPAAVVRNLR